MTAASVYLRRTLLLIAATGFLVGFLPIPVPLSVRNASPHPIEARLDAAHSWVEIGPGESRELARFNHAGLCRPPDRWLPEYFTGLEVRRADGETTRIDRTQFEALAVWGPGESWKLTLN